MRKINWNINEMKADKHIKLSAGRQLQFESSGEQMRAGERKACKFSEEEVHGEES